MTHNTPVVIVAGMGRNTRAIGMKNGLIWHVPADMKRFKALTLGHPIIMGRKTFESIVEILGKPLPGRTNIIVTRNNGYSYPGTSTATSLDGAFNIALQENPTEIHIGGGSEMYTQAIPFVDRIHITLFDDDAEGDTTFPEFEHDFTITAEHEPQEHEGLKFQWIDYKRK
jgi:dihydrofolate reductase